jgi:hypothetical protein
MTMMHPRLLRITVATCAKDFFTVFVDAIFTTLLQRLFTSTTEVIGTRSAAACLCSARHAD